MIYLNVIPDELYFLWQIEILLYNFHSIGINQKDIHVIIGYDEHKGVNERISQFIHECNYALFFTYSDDRTNKVYSASLVQYLIAKHLEAHPYLESEALFIHDSDIIFKHKLELTTLLQDTNWYASYSGDYIGCDYIITHGGDLLFNKMCTIVGISPEIVIANNKNAGGAQYLVKETTASFWLKVANDGELLYKLLLKENLPNGIIDYSKYSPKVNPWYASMWAMWWNSILINRPLQVTDVLDFCWADEDIRRWHTTSILHYSMKYKNDLPCFRKTNYIFSSPYNFDLSGISKDTCSYPLVQTMKKYKENKIMSHIPDLSFVVLMNQRSHILYNYLKSNLKNNCFVQNKTDHDLSEVLSSIETKYVCIINPSYLFSIENIIPIIKENIRKGVKIFAECIYSTDVISRLMFSTMLDFNYLQINIGKFSKEENIKPYIALCFPLELLKEQTSINNLELNDLAYNEFVFKL